MDVKCPHLIVELCMIFGLRAYSFLLGSSRGEMV
jgi:hypothetical protein